MDSFLEKPTQPPSTANPAKKKENNLAEPGEEIRCYRFDAMALEGERNLLEEQDADNLLELLGNISGSLEIFTFLLDNIDAAAEVRGDMLHLLAQELERVNDLIVRIGDAYSTVELVDAA